jgi:hypothetical protein
MRKRKITDELSESCIRLEFGSVLFPFFSTHSCFACYCKDYQYCIFVFLTEVTFCAFDEVILNIMSI